VIDNPDGQLQIVRSTLLDWSAELRMLPNSWEGEAPGTRTIRSKSLTSCLLEVVKPGGSVHDKTKVTGMVDDWLHEILKADAPDDAENCSEMKNILWVPEVIVTALSRIGIPKPPKMSGMKLEVEIGEKRVKLE
jgi:hypothetical protein